MNALSCRWLVFAALVAALRVSVVAAEERPSDAQAPMPRPRLTDTLRVKADDLDREVEANRVVSMDKVIIRARRLPSGPPKEQQTEGKFSIAQGGYVLKNDGAKFSTEVGLWRHIAIVEDRTEALQQGTGIRMGFLRISW